MINAKNVEQQKEHITRTANALIAICENKKEIKGLEWGLSLLNYIIKHPSERGWQSLRNWARVSYVYTQTGGDPLKDTFYEE